MGAQGAALATAIARWFTWIALVVYIYTQMDRQRFGLVGPITGAGALHRKLLRFGVPTGIGMTFESSAFAMMMLFAGWLGEIVVAAFQIAFSLIALPFMVALGFSTAASVFVAQAHGRTNATDVARARR